MTLSANPVPPDMKELVVIDAVAHFELLNAVNVHVNRTVCAGTDFELFGRIEHWVVPEEFGDCEDIVLLKRQKLLQVGLPWQSLLPAAGKTDKGMGHAVLLASTSYGLQVLDSLADVIRPWNNCTITDWYGYADPTAPAMMWWLSTRSID